MVASEEERLDLGTGSHVTSKSLALRFHGLVLGRLQTRLCATKASPSALGITRSLGGPQNVGSVVAILLQTIP